MISRFSALIASIVTLGASSSSSADVAFTYSDFSNTGGLTLIGSTSTAVTADGSVLRLTPALGNRSGAVYSTLPVTLGANATFSTTFQFRFTQPGGWNPADGITFVLAASPSGLGALGVGMGYQGVRNSVAIEFDTFNNANYGLGNNDGNSSNHVSIDSGGVLANANLTNVYGNGSCGFSNGTPPQNPHTMAGCMSNGNLWSVTIGYDGSLLSLRLQDGGAAPFIAFAGVPVDIASALGTNQAYVGFTAATGAGWENHDIVNWRFANTVALAVPEPSTYTLMLVGFAAIALRTRRQSLAKAHEHRPG